MYMRNNRPPNTYESKRCGRRTALPLVVVETTIFCLPAGDVLIVGDIVETLRCRGIFVDIDFSLTSRGADLVVFATAFSSYRVCFSAAFRAFSSAANRCFLVLSIVRCALSFFFVAS
jgi:hypothetical protein